MGKRRGRDRVILRPPSSGRGRAGSRVLRAADPGWAEQDDQGAELARAPSSSGRQGSPPGSAQPVEEGLEAGLVETGGAGVRCRGVGAAVARKMS